MFVYLVKEADTGCVIEAFENENEAKKTAIKMNMKNEHYVWKVDPVLFVKQGRKSNLK